MPMVQINILIFVCFSALTVDGEEQQRCFLSGDENSYCCDNHEEINGTCLVPAGGMECKIGYRSLVGEKCKPCFYGSFGRKCGDICKCKEYERCDHVLGCIKIIITTAEISDQSSITEKLSVNLESTEKNHDEPAGLLHREIVIYSVCTGGFSIFVLFCLLMLRHYSRQNRNSPQTRTIHPLQNGIEDNAPPVLREEGIYETIDESNLEDTSLQHFPANPNINLHSNLSNTSSDTSCTSTHSLLIDGYINPYQLIVLDSEIHEYSLTRKLSSNSSSTASEDTAGGSSYLNPYQTIVTDVYEHDYSLEVYTQTDSSLTFECSASIKCDILSDDSEEHSLGKIKCETEIKQSSFTNRTENKRESKSSSKFIKENNHEHTIFATNDTTVNQVEENRVNISELEQIKYFKDDIQ